MRVGESVATSEAPALEWGIDQIVSQLRALREASLVARRGLRIPAKLPSRSALTNVLEGLIAALFPNRLGARVLVKENVDFFVGHTIDLALRELTEQVARELHFASDLDAEDDEHLQHAAAIVGQFAARLPDIRALLETDIRASFEGDPGARSVDEVLAYYPGVMAVVHYRLANALYELGAMLVARIIGQIAHSLTGVDINPAAKIGASFSIWHGTGVVIDAPVRIGERVRLYHGVTLGVRPPDVGNPGPAPPATCAILHIEDDVVIYSGATILGTVTIGRGATIGGSVWLTRSVPPGSNIAQAPARNDLFALGEGI